MEEGEDRLVWRYAKGEERYCSQVDMLKGRERGRGFGS